MITLEQGVFVTLILAAISGAVYMFSRQIDSKLDEDAANLRFNALEQSLRDHIRDDQAFHARIDTRFDLLTEKMEQIPDKVIARLTEPKLSNQRKVE